jgi:hypothetical protein
MATDLTKAAGMSTRAQERSVPIINQCIQGRVILIFRTFNAAIFQLKLKGVLKL